MLPPTHSTAHCLSHFLCPRCGEPLGVHHAYHLPQPSQILSQLANHPPCHLACVEAMLEETPLTPPGADTPASAIACIAVVKAGPSSPSARLIKLDHPELGGTELHHLHLFTPERIRFEHLSAWPANEPMQKPDAVHTVTRPATAQEIINWITPALSVALHRATSEDERRTIIHQLGLIQSRLPDRDRAAFKAYLEAPPPPKLISTWAELAALPETPTHRLEIDVSNCNGWIKSKHPAAAATLGIYLSTHTFYGTKHKQSTQELQACGWNVTIANWDAPATTPSLPAKS